MTKRLESIEDEINSVDTIDISNTADWFSFKKSEEHDDPFNLGLEDIKKLRGLGTNFKRKLNRDFSKAFVGTSGVGTQQNLLQQAISGYALFDLVEPTYNLEYLSKIYIVGLGYMFAETSKAKDAMDAITDQKQLDRARTKIDRIKTQLDKWLDDCNEEESFTETLIKAYTDLEATGNGYIEIGRTTAGDIGYIGHIPAKTMRVRRFRDGFIQLLYGKAVYFRNFGDLETPSPIAGQEDRPNEIIHLKKYTPMNNYYGVPDIIAAQQALAGNEFAGRYNLDYFENKAVPRYIITVKGAKLSPESERKLLEFFQVGLKGKNHRSLYIPLPADTPDSKTEFKMEPIEAGEQESSFNIYRKSNRDEILLAHRVPISKIGIPEGINLAAARDADKTFKEQVCRPAQDRLEKKLNYLIAEKTDVVQLKFNELSLTDEETQSRIDEIYLRMQVITPNEVRIRKNMTTVEGGDEMVDLKPQQVADQKAKSTGNKKRDQQRSANAPDKSGEARNPKGDGPKVK
jgi:PBSX family phage portal protein